MQFLSTAHHDVCGQRIMDIQCLCAPGWRHSCHTRSTKLIGQKMTLPMGAEPPHCVQPCVMPQTCSDMYMQGCDCKERPTWRTDCNQFCDTASIASSPIRLHIACMAASLCGEILPNGTVCIFNHVVQSTMLGRTTLVTTCGQSVLGTTAGIL